MRGASTAWLAGLVVCLMLMPGVVVADVLSSVGAIPSPFSPNGDGAYDSTAVRYTLSDTAAVVVTIADSTMAELTTLWSGWKSAGDHRHWWDGRVDGLAVDDGLYHAVVQAVPQDGPVEEMSAGVRIDTGAPEIISLEAAPNLFTPDGDGVADSTLVDLVIDDPSSQLAIVVLDAEQEEFVELLATTGVETVSVWWNGADATGTAAGNGIFTISAAASDAAGNSAEAQVLVEIDTMPPETGFVFPDSLLSEFREDATEITATGWAYDPSGISMIEVSVDDGDWTEVPFAGPDTVFWQYALACTACIPDTLDETREIAVRAYDGVITATGDGYVTEAPYPGADVVFDVAGPSHEDSSVDDEDNTYSPGQTVSITSVWDDEGYSLDADFSDLDNQFDAENVTVTDDGGGSYGITYVISTAATTPVPFARVRVVATDHFERSAADSSVTVSLFSGGAAATELSVDVNAFNPMLDEVVEISVGDYEGRVEVEIYNMAGVLVRELSSESTTIVEWDGTNGDGDVVASGVYFLRIETDDEDATRKVAVVK